MFQLENPEIPSNSTQWTHHELSCKKWGRATEGDQLCLGKYLESPFREMEGTEVNRRAEVLGERRKPLMWNKEKNLYIPQREVGKRRNILESWALGDVIPSLCHGHIPKSWNVNHSSMITFTCLPHTSTEWPIVTSRSTCQKWNSHLCSSAASPVQRISAHWHHYSPRILGGVLNSPSQWPVSP